MCKTKGMQVLVVLILLGLAMGEELELRAVEPNRVVLELPSINFTRLYNDISLMNVYNRLFNSMKPTVPPVSVPPVPVDPVVPDVAADEPMKSELPDNIRQTVAAALRQIRNQNSGVYLNPSQQTVNTPRHGPGYDYDYDYDYGYGHRPNSDSLYDLPYPYSGGSGHHHGHHHHHHGSHPNPDRLYAEYNKKYGIATLSNFIPGLTIQEIPYSELSGVGPPYNYYELINDRPHHHHHHHGHHHGYYGSSAYNDRAQIADFRRFLISRYGQRGSVGSQGFQGLSSYQDDYVNDELNEFGDENGDDYGEGDDFGGSWRKANAETETKTKAKQRKGNKRLKKNKERKQRQQLESQQRSRRISY